MFYWSINNFQQLLVHLNFEQSIIQSGVCSYSSPKFCTKKAIFQTSNKIYFIHDLRGRGKFHGVMLEFFCRFFLYIVLFYLVIKSSVDFYDFYFLTIIIPLFPPLSISCIELNVAPRNLLNTVRHYITYRDSPYHNTSQF